MDARNINGETPLVLAAREAKIDHVKLLIENQVDEVSYTEGLTKLKPECFTDINQAHLDMMMSDGTTVMEFVANKVPCTIDVFTQMLDKSITIDERECGLVGKTLAFDRVFHLTLPCFRSDSTSTGCSGAPGTLGRVRGIWTSSLG